VRPEERVSACSGIRPSGGRPLARLAAAAGRHVARRRRFERALTYGARFRAGAGRPRKGSAARQGAGKPVSRLTRFISQDIVCCCALRSARGRCRHSVYRALRPWPSAADGEDRSAEKRDADVRGRGGYGSKESCRLSVGCSRFRCTSLQLARIARCRQRKTSASFRPSRARRTLSR
jgi:hypothetical protein